MRASDWKRGAGARGVTGPLGNAVGTRLPRTSRYKTLCRPRHAAQRLLFREAFEDVALIVLLAACFFAAGGFMCFAPSHVSTAVPCGMGLAEDAGVVDNIT
mmetsp:Transcript_56851/g.157404  ORF Transcript_56851/g.157404 Transcript_56851/m.157404 type:complete len:101 (+) Transcript_56851:85-387(+)